MRFSNRNICRLLAAVLLAFVALNLTACSGNGREEAEKGAIEKTTDQAASQAVQAIKTPLDKTKMTKELGDQRLEEMDKTLTDQEQGGQ